MPVVHNLNVLVVDDQPSMRGLTKVCLKRLGIDRIIDAGTGREALDAMNKQRFDLVISDWLMPDMDGVEFVKKVRGHPILGRTPFIMTSTRELDDEISIAVEAGVDKYLVKPFSVEALKECLEALLGELETTRARTTAGSAA